jgi:SAM-dependent MidA family methyltransferase
LDPAALPPPSEDALRHSARLIELLRSEIATQGGWLSFSRFMEQALYAPGLGYYVAGSAKFGGQGDFVTAPEISPLFGQALAAQIAPVLAQTGGDVLELGAGTGILAAQILDELNRLDSMPASYRILELSPGLKDRQRATLGALSAKVSGRVQWLEAVPDRFSGVILANEVLDAMPVHKIAWHEQGPAEMGVTWRDGEFHWSERALNPGELRDVAQSIDAMPGYESEVSLAGPALIRTLAERLVAGLLLFIDYGFGRAEFYHPQRSRGTLVCHYRHRAHDDVFFHPGLQDISAHVEFSSLAEAGIDSGLELLGYTTQAQFLINCGITELLARSPADRPGSYLPLAAGAQKLLSPAEMGELFKALALGKKMPAPLRGFRSGDKSRLL